jgi:hypothetical protein
MRRALVLALAALALCCAAPAYATRTVAVDAANEVHAFVVGSDGALYHAPPRDVLRRLGGSGLVQEPVAAVRDATGEIAVAARAEDGTVFLLPGGSWSARVPLAGGAAGSPELLLDGDGHLHLFFRGVDGALWWVAQNLTGWEQPESLGEQPAGEPDAILDGQSRPTVWVRETGGQLRVWRHDGAWASALAGGDLASDPAVARHTGDGRLEVFARGLDGTPWFSRQTALGSLALSPWASQSATPILGKPALVVDGGQRLHAFARGADGALWTAHHDGAWSAWTSLGGALTGDPAAGKDGLGLIHVVAPGAANTWVEYAQTAALTWAPTIRPLGAAAPSPLPVVEVHLPAPPPPPPVTPPTYAPKRLVVDLKANAKASKQRAVFKALTVRSVPAGATVTATCAKGCKRTSLQFTNVAGTVSLKPFFAKRAKQGTLKVGTKIRVVVSAPNMIAAVKTLTVRARKAPSVATRCLPPGATVESLCA